MRLAIAAALAAGTLAASAAPIEAARGDAPRRGRTVEFAGRTWNVKAGRALGPGPNDYSDGPDAAAVDAQGRLRLALTPGAGGRWNSVEVSTPDSLGHGEYRWVVAGDLAALDRRTVLGLFTYEDDAHEIDFELGRWGDPQAPDAQFAVQPYAPDSLRRFDTGAAGRLTGGFTWTAAAVRFACWAGTDTTKPPLRAWDYAGPKVPRPGRERTHMNLWVFEGRRDPGAKAEAVTIESFTFTPAK